MVEIATSLGKNGVQDWLIQRVSAVILGIYTLFLVGYFLMHSSLSYGEWQALFATRPMRYGTLLVLLSLLAHAWIGFWIITTDYIKILSLRLVVQLLFIIAVFVCLVWGARILWGIQ